MIRKLALLFTLLFTACTACSEAFMDEPVMPTDVSQAVNEITTISPADVVDPSSVYPFPNNSCVQCQWYFCPPLNSVWQKEICIDYCEDPPAILHEGDRLYRRNV